MQKEGREKIDEVHIQDSKEVCGKRRQQKMIVRTRQALLNRREEGQRSHRKGRKKRRGTSPPPSQGGPDLSRTSWDVWDVEMKGGRIGCSEYVSNFTQFRLELTSSAACALL